MTRVKLIHGNTSSHPSSYLSTVRADLRHSELPGCYTTVYLDHFITTCPKLYTKIRVDLHPSFSASEPIKLSNASELLIVLPDPVQHSLCTVTQNLTLALKTNNETPRIIFKI